MAEGGAREAQGDHGAVMGTGDSRGKKPGAGMEPMLEDVFGGSSWPGRSARWPPRRCAPNTVTPATGTEPSSRAG